MTNPGKTDTSASYSSSPSSYLSAMPSPQQRAALCPPSRNCLVRYVGTVRRWEGGLEKVLDHMFIRVWPGRLWVYVHETVAVHCCVLFPCLSKLMTRLFWNKPGFSEPPMGHCWLCYLDASFEEWKYDRSVRITTGGRLTLAQSTLMLLGFFNICATQKCSSFFFNPMLDYGDQIWLGL